VDASCILNDIMDKLFPNLQEDEIRSNATTKLVTPIDKCRAPYVTAIQETVCNES
jgi:hypothetical protein